MDYTKSTHTYINQSKVMITMFKQDAEFLSEKL